MSAGLERRLEEIVRSSKSLMQVLETARGLDLRTG